MMHVWLFRVDHWPGSHIYNVVIDGQVYDQFNSRKKLRRDDMKSIADGYKEALENYVR